MAITFKTKSLIDAAQRAIDNHEEAKRIWDSRLQEKIDEHAAEWHEVGQPRLRELRDLLTSRLKHGKPVLHSEVAELTGNAARYHSDQLTGLFFTPLSKSSAAHQAEKPPYLHADVRDHRSLIELLTAHTGDTITSAQLTAIGYKNLARLFNDAVRDGAEA